MPSASPGMRKLLHPVREPQNPAYLIKHCPDLPSASQRIYVLIFHHGTSPTPERILRRSLTARQAVITVMTSWHSPWPNGDGTTGDCSSFSLGPDIAATVEVWLAPLRTSTARLTIGRPGIGRPLAPDADEDSGWQAPHHGPCEGLGWPGWRCAVRCL